MEKRRNTLDRWQRLRFGRRAASNPPEDQRTLSGRQENVPTDTQDAVTVPSQTGRWKTERLRELTELLSSSSHRHDAKYFVPQVSCVDRKHHALSNTANVSCRFRGMEKTFKCQIRARDR